MFLYYCWVQRYIICKYNLNNHKQRKFHPPQKNCSLLYTPTTCTKTIDHNLIWDDFEQFYALITFSQQVECRNPNIGFTIKSEIQGPMRVKMCLGLKHIFTNERKCKGWNLMTPKCTPTLGVALVWELWMFRILVGRANKHQIGP